jgi:hypothetical protein
MLGRGYKKDFFYYLLAAKDPETGEGFETKELWGEANVLMIAGIHRVLCLFLLRLPPEII